MRVSTLVEKYAEKEIDIIRRSEKSNLVNEPISVEDAHRHICGYLSGTRKWWAWRLEEEVKKSPEYGALSVSDFKTKAAQELRDNRLQKQAISFAHQAIRFRGKANYREALYLAHERTVESSISGFISDMGDVLAAFTAITGAFCFACLGTDLRDAFLRDIEKNRSFSLNPRNIWS